MAVPPARAVDANPCLDPNTSANLLCPDIVMSSPFNLYQQKTPRHHKLLHAANSLNSVGDGPIEIRGYRSGRHTMRAEQHIHRISGPILKVNTGAQLVFKNVPGFGGSFWKFNHTAQFQLWRLNAQGVRTRIARNGEKNVYCLRDLVRTRPELDGPRFRHYPRCNQDPHKQAVTLGTSVGWSDIYPANYYEQYIDVTGLKGCFAYVHVGDPDNHIYESNERNNTSQTIVRLPFKGGARGCKALPPGKTGVPAPLPENPPPITF